MKGRIVYCRKQYPLNGIECDRLTPNPSPHREGESVFGLLFIFNQHLQLFIMRKSLRLRGTIVLTIFTFIESITYAQIDPGYLQGLQWRMIGPHRGGRTVGATGVPHQPNVFYIGVNNGGVWKTADYGRTWDPIFDDQSTGSIGDLAVASSNPNVIYVGSGEGIQRPDLSVGNGVYKSTNAGKTWTLMGLSDAQQIGGVAIDPNNENRVFVAALGHPYGPNADRWAGRQGPWENGAWNGPSSGLFKSMDGGNTWKQLTTGLPTTQQGLGRIGFAIAPSDPNRIYATVESPQLG